MNEAARVERILWLSGDRPLDRQASTDQQESTDKIEPALAAEPIESTEASEPTEPTDRIEPAEPIDRTEPDEPIDRIDPLDPMLRMEPEDPGERDEPAWVRMRTLWQPGPAGQAGDSPAPGIAARLRRPSKPRTERLADARKCVDGHRNLPAGGHEELPGGGQAGHRM